MLAKPISFDDIPENLCQLYDIVGEKLFTEIVEVHGGELLYIPRRETMERKHRQEAIRKEYNGYNVSQLALKYGYSERHIRTILSLNKKRTSP